MPVSKPCITDDKILLFIRRRFSQISSFFRAVRIGGIPVGGPDPISEMIQHVSGRVLRLDPVTVDGDGLGTRIIPRVEVVAVDVSVVVVVVVVAGSEENAQIELSNRISH